MNWQYEYNVGSFINTPPTVVNDSLVVMTGDFYLSCFWVNSGAIKWRTQYSETANLQSFNFVQSNDHLYATHLEDVLGWDMQTGEEVWKLSLPGKSGRYHSLNNGYIYIAGNSEVKSINLFDGINYTIDIKGFAASAIFNDGKLYCGSGWTTGSVTTAGRILCLDAASGDSLWAFDTERGGFYSMAPIIEDGVVYCGASEGYADFYALDAETGQQIWKRNELWGNHAIIVDDIIYVNNGGDVTALNKSDGSLIWFLHTNYVENTPMAYWDGYIYHLASGVLFIINAQTGEEVHRMISEDETYLWYVSSGAGKIFLQSTEHLYCYDPWEAD